MVQTRWKVIFDRAINEETENELNIYQERKKWFRKKSKNIFSSKFWLHFELMYGYDENNGNNRYNKCESSDGIKYINKISKLLSSSEWPLDLTGHYGLRKIKLLC